LGSEVTQQTQPLVEAAVRARERAIAGFSNFRVGAALEAEDGTIYSGCNVESAAYGMTMCAERVAVWKALSEGAQQFKRLAIVADTERLTPPCGACRQIIWEFCGDIPVVLGNLRGDAETLRMSELLPRPFDVTFLAKGGGQS